MYEKHYLYGVSDPHDVQSRRNKGETGSSCAMDAIAAMDAIDVMGVMCPTHGVRGDTPMTPIRLGLGETHPWRWCIYGIFGACDIHDTQGTHDARDARGAHDSYGILDSIDLRISGQPGHGGAPATPMTEANQLNEVRVAIILGSRGAGE